MRVLVLVMAALLVDCRPAPVASTDPTAAPSYIEDVRQLTQLARDADGAFQRGRPDEAAALIEKAQPVMKRVVSVPHPSFAAVAAASDLDDLYGRMLLSNRHYGWARLLFQKNLARWKHWTPATLESGRRLKQAEAEIEECDRHL